VLGPNFSGESSNFEQRQVAANLSKTIDKNCQLVSNTEKTRGNHSGRGTDLLSNNSQPGRFATNPSRLGHATGASFVNQGITRWKVYKCKECQVWTHASNEVEGRYALLLNNAYNAEERKKIAKLGLLTGQDGDGHQTGGGVRVPNLEKIKLRLPF